MGANTNRRKDKQLGMSFGAACNKLRRNVMFSLLVKLEENICYRCGKEIESPQTLSIEHKQNWLDASPELFWDLENIAFSHRKCNRPREGTYQKAGVASLRAQVKKCPPGFGWCYRCKKFRPICEFHRNRSRICGLQKWCKRCQKEAKKISESNSVARVGLLV